jgi:hypothetical protein
VKRWWSALGFGSSSPASSDVTPTFTAIGYPKVGNTWLRITLGRYLAERYRLETVPLMDAPEFPLLSKAGCRAIGEFTHRPLEWTSQTARDLSFANVVEPFTARPVLLLTRYPLDAVVSFYMQERYRDPSTAFDGSIADFLEHPVFGLDKVIRFHQVWDEGRRHATVHLWRYEDAIADAAKQFERVLSFLGEPVEQRSVAAAVKAASFENLRALEVSGQQPRYKSSDLPIFAVGDPSNENALHNRRGLAGGYRDEIPAALIPALEERIARDMPAWFGYQNPPSPKS